MRAASVTGGSELCFGVLIRRVQLAVDERVSASLIHLDEVGAFLYLLANHFDNLLGTVGVVGVGEYMLRGIEVIGVFVSAEDVDGVAADAQAWPGNQPTVDGVAHGRVSGARSLRSHVALGGKAGHQIGLGCQRCQDRALRNRLLYCLQIFRTGMQEEMDVRVDQPGHQGDVAEIDDLGSRGMADVRSGFDDALTLNQDFTGSDDLSVFDIEHARGVQNDGRLRLRARQGGAGRNVTNRAKTNLRVVITQKC